MSVLIVVLDGWGLSEVMSAKWMEGDIIFMQYKFFITCLCRATLKEMEPSHNDKEPVRRRPSSF